MNPATDCTNQRAVHKSIATNHSTVSVDKDINGNPITNSAGEPIKPSPAKDVAELLPQLFTVGDMADAATRRGFVCTRDTVQWFIRKKHIQPIRRAGNYRMFSQAALDLLCQHLENRKRKRA